VKALVLPEAALLLPVPVPVPERALALPVRVRLEARLSPSPRASWQASVVPEPRLDPAMP
jgi:hypothetical protein